MKVLGLILCGAKQDGLGVLTTKRTSAAVPMFGKYRAIDFTLSNMINAGISKVGVLTQYNPRSLMDHLNGGKEWNLDRKRGGLFILQPFLSDNDDMHYKGTADAIFQNLTLLRRGDEDFVLIGSGDHIYNMNYLELFKQHVKNGADITVVTKPHEEIFDIQQYGQIITEPDGRIKEIHEKRSDKISDLMSTGIYFINKALLIELLYSAVPNGKFDLLNDLILPNLKRLRVYSHKFEGYWRNIKKTRNIYYNSNLDILNRSIRKELFYSGRKIYTKLKDYAPPKINISARISRSFIADGCIINGSVNNSVLSRGVLVKAGALIENSVIFEDTVIEEGAIIRNAIIDKNVIIRSGKTVDGYNDIVIIEKDEVI